MDAPQWELLSRAPVFTHPRLQLVEDTVELPSNESATYLREPPGAHDAITVIATDDGWLLAKGSTAIPAPDIVLWQLPGRGVEAGESPHDAAASSRA